MKIPFLPKDIVIHQDRVDFTTDYRGGGYMLIAGSIFWILTFLLTYILGKEAEISFYIYGGLSIPFLGYAFQKLLGLKPMDKYSIGFFIATILN